MSRRLATAPESSICCLSSAGHVGREWKMNVSAIRRTMLIVVSVASLAVAADTRLADAAKRGDNQAVRTFLKQQADVNVAQPDGATALAWASYHDDLAMADLLITAGAKVN